MSSPTEWRSTRRLWRSWSQKSPSWWISCTSRWICFYLSANIVLDQPGYSHLTLPLVFLFSSAQLLTVSAGRSVVSVTLSAERTLSLRRTCLPSESSSTCSLCWMSWRTWNAASRTTTLPTKGIQKLGQLLFTVTQVITAADSRWQHQSASLNNRKYMFLFIYIYVLYMYLLFVWVLSRFF